MNAFMVATFFLAAYCASSSCRSETEPSLAPIRSTPDGAGPSHLFWLSQDTASADIIGVVDPLFSAIRFFSVARNSNEALLSQRVRDIGACALPIDFRPWKVYQTDAGVLLESTPSPGDLGHTATRKAFRSSTYHIDRDVVIRLRDSMVDALATLDTSDWNPAAALQCGHYLKDEKGVHETQVGKYAPYRAARGVKHARRTIVLANKPESLSTQEQLIIRAVSGNTLYSAHELEPFGDSRVVQISEGIDTSDGMLRTKQRILVYVKGALKAEWSFDETLLKSKLGVKPLVVLPTGELLAMGNVNKQFQMQSCGNLKQATSKRSANGQDDSICKSETDTISARSIPDLVPVEEQPIADQTASSTSTLSPRTVNTNVIFSRVRPISQIVWSVDTTAMPVECRKASGCKSEPRMPAFIPIRGIRLTRGIYRKTGVAYAQVTTESMENVIKFMQLARSSEPTFSKSLAGVLKGSKDTPGNLNDHFVGEVGIDCSALIQMAWGASEESSRLTTHRLQEPNRLSYRCPTRIPGIGQLKPGDAISVNIGAGRISEKKNKDPNQVGLNEKEYEGPKHVVLFASNIRFDGANESYIVLESASGCDGVCWSVYDPSFFNGWGMYRAAGRQDAHCPQDKIGNNIATNPLPRTFSAWREQVQAKRK